jgi:hypothetical protein
MVNLPHVGSRDLIVDLEKKCIGDVQKMYI